MLRAWEDINHDFQLTYKVSKHQNESEDTSLDMGQSPAWNVATLLWAGDRGAVVSCCAGMNDELRRPVAASSHQPAYPPS